MIGGDPVRTLDTPNPKDGFLRDIALLRRLVAMLFQYWVGGGRLRREYRRRAARGEVYWVDASGGTRHRDEALRRP
jgi:hypothetical protein